MQFKRISKILSLYKAFFKASLVSELEYRLNFILLISGEFIWYASQLVFFEIIYRHTGIIGDWDIHQMRVFIILFLFVDAIYMFLWDQNFIAFNDNVRKGGLDLLLMKPIDSLFMISSQKMSVSHIPTFLITGGGLIWAVSQIPDFEWSKLFWLFILIPSGLSVIFCFRFALNATAILFTRADFLQYLWYSMFKLGMRPDTIYPGVLRVVIIFVLPFAMVASIPARILMEPVHNGILIWACAMPFILIYLLKKYWRFCLKFYSSASS